MAEVKYSISFDLTKAQSMIKDIEKSFKSIRDVELDEIQIPFSSSNFGGLISQIKGGEIEYHIKNENDEYCPLSKEDFIKRAAQYEALVLEGVVRDIADGSLKVTIEAQKNKDAEIIDNNIEITAKAPEIEEKPIRRKKVQEIEKDKDKDREEKGPTLEEVVAEKEKNDEEIIQSNPQIDSVR